MPGLPWGPTRLGRPSASESGLSDAAGAAASTPSVLLSVVRRVIVSIRIADLLGVFEESQVVERDYTLSLTSLSEKTARKKSAAGAGLDRVPLPSRKASNFRDRSGSRSTKKK